MPTEPTTARYRVTLPKDARRPHQVITGLAAAPRLVFSAAFSLKVPASTQKTTVPRRTVDLLIEAGGESMHVVLRQLVQRRGISLEAQQDPMDHVPGSEYPAILEHAERLTAAPSKTLQLAPREVTDLRALGFDVQTQSSTTRQAATDADPAATDASTQEA